METSRKRSSSGLLSRSSDSVAGAEEEAAEEEAGTCHRWICGLFEKPSEKKGHMPLIQVRQVVQKNKSLKKISFLAHSLGGLSQRHAVAVLYSAAVSQASDGAALSNSGNSHLPRGSLAGLEPMNFITLATPHLGVRT
ncbi:unnamed protein product [Brassica rapa]|uniref:DUF676 domain-containing protein n=1 Tax=Brassica campestris TaxID=3711 RepID=A0A8D9HZ00_BRACM|nr:unnamed protein product [Brassica rapa]